ncbi:hypothetical protein Cme02nite_00230 [Catellatospora methionotrophica]|uniref:Uncharacterized protein n=1 Tax=Catellatospora methionotrophica TaxID=121620 RepID=A0A8J3LAW5_9ACTN|nr:hypothetical protein [Catellatospora methionotrophica]GIG11691.1 hypothetical protein Cme02nite_00230 [Catellatospora methionotrophica]
MPAARRVRGRLSTALMLVVVLAVGATVAVLVRDWMHGFFDRIETAGRTSVVTPDKLGTLPKATEATLTDIVASLRSAYAREKALDRATSSVVAAYGSTKKKDAVIVVGFAVTIVSPGTEVDAFLNGVAAGEVVAYTDLDPGPLGGQAKCGTMKTLFGKASAVCAWADNGSVGGLMFLDRPLSAQIKERFLAARAQIEKVEVAPSA